MIGPANMKADHEGGRHQAGVAVLQSVDGLIAILL